MAKIKYIVLTATAAPIIAAYAENAPASNSIAANRAATTVSAAPIRDELVAREKRAYQAWKSKDAKFWGTFLSDKFVGWGSSGRLNKASATKEYTGADCDIKSYAMSDEQMRPLGNNSALITYKITVDGTCGQQKVPAESWAASVFVRDGGKWQAAFHAQDTIVDPNAAPVKPGDNTEPQREDKTKPTDRDAHTEAMLELERSVWEAWRAHDAKNLAALTARDISFINIFGTYLATKTDALSNWSGAGCDVKSVAVVDAAATMLSPTVGILTFKATADGTCYGQKVGPIWGTSVYVMDGDGWKWTFGINVPARRQGT
jgi:hypothetical protein